MNKDTRLVVALIACTFLFITVPCEAQVSGGASYSSISAQSKHKLEINLEPVQTVNVRQEIIEILPGGSHVLQTGSSTGLSVGATGGGGFGFKGGPILSIEQKLVQLNKDGMVLQVTITDRATGKILASRELALGNYQEGIVELASDESQGRRLAVRLLPTISTKDPVQEYPALVKSFGASGILLLNGKEVLFRGGVKSSIEDVRGTKQQFYVLGTDHGQFVLSYRPFSNASIHGYFDGKELLFELNGDLYEWISEEPFLPEGRWAAYIWQADTTPAEGFSCSALSANPEGVAKQIQMMSQARQGFRPQRKQ
jgi:hypothetical protein